MNTALLKMQDKYVNIPNHQPMSADTLKKIREDLPKFLSGHRLEHTFFVEKEAFAIAEYCFMVYNIPDIFFRDISAAALLHDITKPLSLPEHISLCEKYGIEADQYQRNSPQLLHSKTAAYLARDIYGINNIVFSAILNHTTGKENMNLFDKIIFLADYIEPSRTHTKCKEVRDYFYSLAGVRKNDGIIDALDFSIIKSIDGTISYLLETGQITDVQTIFTRNQLISQHDRGNEKNAN